MTALAVAAVSKAYGTATVLQEIELTVPERSVTALLGPSGCGKTTLLRLVAGFDRPDAGTIAIGGRTVVGDGRPVPAERRGVGYVPQEGALFPHLTAGANAVFGLPRRERSKERARELLTGVGLDGDLAARYPHQLSGGQQQRIALARALAPAPALVLLDEPFSSLDAALRESTRHAVLAVLAEARTTTLLVTHDQAEALSMADQVAVMRDGRIVQVAPPTELYRSPADAGVAAFVGAAVLLPAQLDGDHALSPLGRVPLAAGANSSGGRLLLRPEQLRLGTDGVPARVHDVSYYGHDCSVVLDLLPDGPRVTARVLGTQPPHRGDTLHISVAGTGVLV